MNQVTATLFASCAALGCSVAASAEDVALRNATVSSIVVGYADLDLDKSDGTQTLYARLRSAASQVCGGEPLLVEMVRHSRYEACVAGTLDEAVGQVQSRSLQALHESRKTDSSMS